MGGIVPSHWSVLCGREIVALDAAKATRLDDVLCSVSPDPIHFGDTAFAQIDVFPVTRAYLEEAIKKFEERGLPSQATRFKGREAVLLQEPVKPDEASKADPQGYDLFIIIGPDAAILVRKGSRGNPQYEEAAKNFVDTLEPNEPGALMLYD